MQQSVLAVSYTHLDVYKRQDKDSWATEYAELKGLLSEDEYAAARASTLNAVSYTHLDRLHQHPAARVPAAF